MWPGGEPGPGALPGAAGGAEVVGGGPQEGWPGRLRPNYDLKAPRTISSLMFSSIVTL